MLGNTKLEAQAVPNPGPWIISTSLDKPDPPFTTAKPCIYAVDMKLVNETETQVFDLSDIHTHRATIHSILFTAQAFQDLSLGKHCGKIAQFHLGKTLCHLQQSLNDRHGAVAMPTIAIVAMLASAAAVFGDLQTVEKHMNGLLDLALAMGTNREPRLFPKEISWDPQIAPSGCTAWYKELEEIHPPLDPKLLTIWADLKCYSKIANRVQSGLEIKPDLFLTLSTSVPNRLLHLEYDSTSLAELMRLSMLAYIKGLLFQIPGIGRNMRYLSERFSLSLQAQQYPPPPEHAQFVFWALFISGLSIFESFDQEWHRTALAKTASILGVVDWTQAKSVLESVLWVDRIYDAGAKVALETILCQ
ncbi:uncharacterized protein NECHADRAFT_84230 [Fusarium vanettenii 77-13-4]|uniref:Transcription factor domain-containing protein n=1 Tax=Fusarium vanettenii (strain ATCC MYA-4622 / CBS 123669 / FGSC 9596 / NRRL 45880 / 77-13-4) TaxID=660122 RepID=C7Z029_FUSV7|nr:uncharacterized protein NECHADRAFT_84230 [Fusarium vanettenii 77-13-4]EEU42714.1 hypothetical protein NECHADRAFT_84230 [Fusarium vanettenii 77-13-4]